MWDQTLKKINHSITPQKAATLWGADPSSVKLVSEGINLVYRFETNNFVKYLRITHEKIRNYTELISAIDFQKHLFQLGVPICQAVESSRHNFVEEVVQDDLTFLAHVCKEVPGQIIHFDYSEQDIYVTWGQSLAKLHLAAKQYRPGPQCQFKNWQDLWEETFGYLKLEDEIIKREFQNIDVWLKTLVQDRENFGLTHGDHRPGNVLYDGIQVYIIDFDEPVYHWFVADIARPFLDLCDKPFNLWRDKFLGFIEGYRKLLPITNNQIKNISWFLRLKNLEIYLWVKNNWQDPVAPGGGSSEAWLAQLRRVIENPEFIVGIE